MNCLEEMYEERARKVTHDTELYYHPTGLQRKKRILEFIGKPKGKNIVDLGCGNGFITKELAEQNYVLGVDISRTRLHRASMNGLYIEWTDDASHTTIQNDTADYVVCTELLEHAPYPEKVVAEAWRLLRPGGKAVFTVPLDGSITQTHLHAFTTEKLLKMLTDAGFTITNKRYTDEQLVNPPLHPLLWLAKRLQQRWLATLCYYKTGNKKHVVLEVKK